MTDISEKTMEALNAINEMCEILQKAAYVNPKSEWEQIQAHPNVPEYPDEAIQSAKRPPVSKTKTKKPEIVPELPTDLSQYDEDRLHLIVQHASKKIAEALMHSILAHKNPTPVPEVSNKRLDKPA